MFMIIRYVAAPSRTFLLAFFGCMFCLCSVARAEPAAPSDAQSSQRVYFQTDVVPLLTRYGCNGGGCHGKAVGQNGFKLSLLGYEPDFDHETIVREARSRRISLSVPRRSLLLLKATAALPHGGGKRIDPASADYDVLVRWIEQGDPLPRMIRCCSASALHRISTTSPQAAGSRPCGSSDISRMARRATSRGSPFIRPTNPRSPR